MNHGFVVGTGTHGIAQGKIAGQGQHQRGFPYCFAVEGRWLDVVVLEKADLEMFRHVAGHRNFVSARAMCEQLAFLVPDALLHGEPTHALHIGAFNLAFVDGGVDAVAHVMHDVDRFEPPLTGAGVNLDFGYGSAITVVLESTAIQSREVVFDFGGHVETRDRQAHAF